jgi:lecithin:retinol acyltransferase
LGKPEGSNLLTPWDLHRGWAGHSLRWGAGQQGKRTAPIRQTTLEEFAKGGEVKVLTYRLCLKPDDVVERASGKLDQQQYDLAFNNCEHFATWCKTGRAESHQVNGAGGLAGGVVGGVAGAAAAVASVSVAGTVSGLSAAGITSGLAAIGLGAGMVGGIAVVAGAPLLVGGVGYFVGRRVVHWWRSEHAEAENVFLLPGPPDCEGAPTPRVVPSSG